MSTPTAPLIWEIGQMQGQFFLQLTACLARLLSQIQQDAF